MKEKADIKLLIDKMFNLYLAYQTYVQNKEQKKDYTINLSIKRDNVKNTNINSIELSLKTKEDVINSFKYESKDAKSLEYISFTLWTKILEFQNKQNNIIKCSLTRDLAYGSMEYDYFYEIKNSDTKIIKEDLEYKYKKLGRHKKIDEKALNIINDDILL